jgi:GNAT superfamily N-acetyltransferase
MTSFSIRHAEKFPEPGFSALNRAVFVDMQQPSAEWASALAAEAESATRAQQQQVHSPMYRLGAYVQDELVGWTCGWMERGNVFYVANSGVLASHRRQGIYTALMSAIRDHAKSMGAVAVRSRHSVMNNPVIIAKLRAGFHISGLSHAAEMGTLVEMTLHFFPEREALFRERALPYVVPVA